MDNIYIIFICIFVIIMWAYEYARTPKENALWKIFAFFVCSYFVFMLLQKLGIS